MKKRALAIVAASAFVISAIGAPALAAPGGNSADNNCTGKIWSAAAHEPLGWVGEIKSQLSGPEISELNHTNKADCAA